MTRTKCKLTCTGDMFGRDVKLKYNNKQWIVGQDLSYDPIAQMSTNLSEGYLFRSPKLNPEFLDEIWETMEQFTNPYNVWVEAEDKDEDAVEFTAFARIFDRSEATMFAYSHSLFEKWSNEKEAEDVAERSKPKQEKLKVNDDGTVTITVDVTELSK